LFSESLAKGTANEHWDTSFSRRSCGQLASAAGTFTRAEQRQQGSISAEAVRVVEGRAIREVAKLQEAIGLQGITDGEYRRTIWHADFCDRLKALPSRKALPTPRALRAGFNRVVRKSNAHRRAFMRRGGSSAATALKRIISNI
jgi:hypothetical protein